MKGIICTPISYPSITITLLLLIMPLIVPSADATTRIKDIVIMHTDNEVDLIGYGLVIGLDGTGDGKGAPFTMQSLANMIERMGITVNSEQLKIKNVAAVMVTGRLSSHHQIGDRIDVTVSSVVDASSLKEGTILMTPLATLNGDVYATAQGPVSIAHGKITVNIKSHPVISQPEPFSGGETVVAAEYRLSVEEEKARIVDLKESVSLAEVAVALNSIGAAPRDIIAIFSAMKQAGALRAELVII